jgi:hypothetical protein
LVLLVTVVVVTVVVWAVVVLAVTVWAVVVLAVTVVVDGGVVVVWTVAAVRRARGMLAC